MANTLKIRRGSSGSLPTLEAGELGYATDTKEVFVGSGTGNHSVSLHAKTVAKTGNYTVTADDLKGNKTFTNTGATAEINFSLPAGAINYKVHFMVTAGQYLKVTANGSEKFRYLAVQGAAGGYIRSNEIGTCWTLTWSGADWVISSREGEINYDQ